MVGSLVRFLFTCCEESQTHSFAALTRSFAILHNSWIKIVRTHQPWSNLYLYYQFFYSELFTTTHVTGQTKKPLPLTEGRLGSTHRKPNFPPTGTHPSPRSVSVWRSANRSGLLSSTSRRTPCTLWSLMGNTATPHWGVTHGSHWLALRPPCRLVVTGKDLTLRVISSI